ncbi:KpsF/GutQ family sugar-phosphate isomerase [Pandoraea terrae]
MPNAASECGGGTFKIDDAIESGRRTLQLEADSLLEARSNLGHTFGQIVQTILGSSGRVIATGVGKSGHVCRKIAATLASTGTPAFSVHPTEASHGDLGMITGDDIVLAVSNSGETDELVQILPAIKSIGVTLIAITSSTESTLAQLADITLESKVVREACPLNLAPTASTTLQLAIGDAIAIAIADARGFDQSDFARSHPGGRLGRRLVTRVRDVMRIGDRLPVVFTDASVLCAMASMSGKNLGAAIVVDQGYQLLGIVADGDLRRCLERGLTPTSVQVGEVMTRTPRTAHPDVLATEVADLIECTGISVVPVVDDQYRLLGAVSTHDLMRAGVL